MTIFGERIRSRKCCAMKFNCQNKNRWWSVGRVANRWRDDEKLARECRVIIRMLPGESRVTVFREARKVSDEGGSDLSGFRGDKRCVFRVLREAELFEKISQSFVTRINQRTNRRTRIRIVRCKWFAFSSASDLVRDIELSRYWKVNGTESPPSGRRLVQIIDNWFANLIVKTHGRTMMSAGVIRGRNGNIN